MYGKTAPHLVSTRGRRSFRGRSYAAAGGSTVPGQLPALHKSPAGAGRRGRAPYNVRTLPQALQRAGTRELPAGSGCTCHPAAKTAAAAECEPGSIQQIQEARPRGGHAGAFIFDERSEVPICRVAVEEFVFESKEPRHWRDCRRNDRRRNERRRTNGTTSHRSRPASRR